MATQDTQNQWNGVDLPYIPAEPLDIPESVTLHDEAATDVDPVTHEVVRHSLWNANRENGNTIENLAVSLITLATRDFQTAILTEDGEFVYFGPYLQYFAGTIDVFVKWLIEHRGAEAGIDPGDMFLSNDPWIVSPHQPDVGIVAPVFHEGEIFCWVANMMHHVDVGGVDPGSFCVSAEDIFDDPPCLPPMKIVAGGEISAEREAIFRRTSRMPDQVAMDLRAGIAGNNVAVERVEDLIDQYGAATVKGSMRKLIRDGEAAVAELLADIPDGTWRERIYRTEAYPDDESLHPVQMNLHKEGSQLTFDNAGTGRQVGSANNTYAVWRGAIVSMVNLLTQPEKMGATGGLIRHLDFDLEPRTMNAPEYGIATQPPVEGAAVSPAGSTANEISVSLANSVVSKMLLSTDDPALRAKATAPTMAQWQGAIAQGADFEGNIFIGPMVEGMIGCTGPTPERDGEFANGLIWVPEGRGPNVEENERRWPIMYLYRDELPDSGGAGRRRGGNGGRVAFTFHEGMGEVQAGAGGIPMTVGLFGGSPGNRSETLVVHGSNVNDRFAAGDPPTEVRDLDGDRQQPAGMAPDIVGDPNTAIEWWWGTPGGYGDPLTREPERVAQDVRRGAVSAETAEAVYGVVLENGTVDVTATEQLRERRRQARLADADPVGDE